MNAPTSGFYGFGNHMQSHPLFWKIVALMPEVTMSPQHNGNKRYQFFLKKSSWNTFIQKDSKMLNGSHFQGLRNNMRCPPKTDMNIVGLEATILTHV